ncbi:hypothetical protein IHP72_05955 [Bacillus pumilus]|uniref:YopX family protein n=1 Tax=Bacillus pumilus TaxID=1408 RepID=UPI001B39D9BE|nr:YopX family protein [Bacillus pumilus]MBQ4815786.1 hypothetical protein [Bacillus pumilus]
MDIFIRYVFKHRFSGNIEIKKYSTSQLEACGAKKLSPCFNETDYELIARNLCFDEEKSVFVGDLINVTTRFGNYIALVKLGEYEQDGSGDEYAPSKCFGFYAEATDPDRTNEDGYVIVSDYLVQNSLIRLDSYKVIGNIYQNPNLLEEAHERK